MNEIHINQIFKNYIEKFEYLNNESNDEKFKWFIAKGFRSLMDEALSKSGADFADALYKAKAYTENLIDGYTQPFYGLVEFARHEPETVRQMFLDLYSGDGNDILDTEKRIADFYAKSIALLEKYEPDSYRYKQDFHAISGYLFLYDPEHHYLFKSSHASIFADCIEFYDDWGSGMDIRLDVYYRMCDWVVEQIKKSPELLATNQSRYELPGSEDMALDINKHILVFDLIFCCSVYDLFDGITFVRPKSKDKHLIAERRKKAAELLAKYNAALDEQHKYEEATFLLKSYLSPGTVVYHKTNGQGIIQSCVQSRDGDCTLEVSFEKVGLKTLKAKGAFANKVIKTKEGILEQKISEYLPYLQKDPNSFASIIRYSEQELKPYEDYL